jgi:hypothetical protein
MVSSETRARLRIMYLLISGIVAMGCWVVGLFFWQFWHRSRDRLFGVFSIAFFVLGIERVIPVFLKLPDDESRAPLYLVRLAAFALILIGIIDKNRKSEKLSSEN